MSFSTHSLKTFHSFIFKQGKNRAANGVNAGKSEGSAARLEYLRASSVRRRSLRITTCNHIIHDECLMRDAMRDAQSQSQSQSQGSGKGKVGNPSEAFGDNKKRTPETVATGSDSPTSTSTSSSASASASACSRSSDTLIFQAGNCVIGGLQCPICRKELGAATEA